MPERAYISSVSEKGLPLLSDAVRRNKQPRHRARFLSRGALPETRRAENGFRRFATRARTPPLSAGCIRYFLSPLARALRVPPYTLKQQRVVFQAPSQDGRGESLLRSLNRRRRPSRRRRRDRDDRRAELGLHCQGKEPKTSVLHSNLQVDWDPTPGLLAFKFGLRSGRYP